jgi:hypothetical protein
MRSKLWQPIAVIVAAGFSSTWPVPAAADTVVLKTGEVFNGRVLRVTKDEVSIQLDSGGILSFRLGRVDRIRQPDPVRGGSREYIVKDHDGAGESSDPAGAGEKAKDAGAPGSAGDKVGPPQVSGPKEEGPTGHREALSGFPLHALRAPSAAPPASVTGWTGPTKVLVPDKGYSIVPPPGFETWSDPKLPPVLRGFIDPLTQANITVSVYDSDEPLDRIKEGIVALLSRQSRSKVVREERREVSGPEGYKGWYISMETPISGTTVEQVQLIAKSARKVFVVTCSAAVRKEINFDRAFDACLDSFRIESDEKADAAPEEQESSQSAPPPPSVLREPPAPPARTGGIGPGEIDERRLKDSSDRITDRVDDRIRHSPLGKW